MNLAATSGKLMRAAIMYPSKSSALFATIFVAGSVALAAAAEIGPPPGAVLSVDKLSRIDDFFNAEDATGRMPGAIVLIQRHGKPVYLKMPGVSEIFPIGLTRLV